MTRRPTREAKHTSKTRPRERKIMARLEPLIGGAEPREHALR